MEDKKKETKKVKSREEELNEMLQSGELSTMTECAYGKSIADAEAKKKVNLNK